MISPNFRKNILNMYRYRGSGSCPENINNSKVTEHF